MLRKRKSRQEVRTFKKLKTDATSQPVLKVAGPKLPSKHFYTGDGIRDNCLTLFYQSFLKACEDKDGEETKQKMAMLAKKIEEHIFGSISHGEKYKLRSRSILLNLRDKNNPEFVRNVINGVIKAEDVCKLTGDEMLSRERLNRKQMASKKNLERCIRQESELVPMKLEADGSLGSCMTGGSGGTVWVSRDMVNKSDNLYD
ncbi:16956_t:CDS:2 [Funneliformis geosporum]|uniref:16760_t:CDS:1 n=1 Tax=Funneliformis geosporum TaxID=1117311 RepID=A0A9W4SCX7_9GLOM|nr:16956_t:CDS:2 [Funneliformis geosporum]CAI2163908.1 16760_t:CDS:2 [Funneliformis geosporum]